MSFLFTTAGLAEIFQGSAVRGAFREGWEVPLEELDQLVSEHPLAAGYRVVHPESAAPVVHHACFTEVGEVAGYGGLG